MDFLKELIQLNNETYITQTYPWIQNVENYIHPNQRLFTLSNHDTIKFYKKLNQKYKNKNLALNKSKLNTYNCR